MRSPRPHDASAEVGQVLVEIQRVRSGALSDRGFAGDRLVAGELRLEHSLAAGHARKPVAKLLDS